MNDSLQNANITEQDPLDILRENIEREYRFKTVPMGYDKGNVRDFIREQKQAEADLRKGLEEENERLKAELADLKENSQKIISELQENSQKKIDEILLDKAFELDTQKAKFMQEKEELNAKCTAELESDKKLLEETKAALKETNIKFETLCSTICTNVADWLLEYKNSEKKLDETLKTFD